MADFPGVASACSNTPATAHPDVSAARARLSCTDTDAVAATSRRSSGRWATTTLDGFIGATVPARSPSTTRPHYPSHRAYCRRLARRLRTSTGRSPTRVSCCRSTRPTWRCRHHFRSVGSRRRATGAPTSPTRSTSLNGSLDGIPREQMRLHVCWGNYGGPHHHDIPLAEIIGEALRSNVGAIYVEAGNPRHAHEWRVFEDVEAPRRQR